MSDLQRERRLEELFGLAVELGGLEREEFLARHCAGDRALREQLEALLRQDDEGTKDYLASPVISRTTGTAPSAPGGVLPAGSVPERVGRYRLERRLGEGGMGAVYLAEQESPVRRQVALKIVKLGMDTEKVIARFERERQTLALMDHPGIARILDGGSTESGRPYFVMEYVPGLPIQEFCDRERLGLHERLELFAEVCDAVQHAHQKGVVHRDLKPSNVLVSLRDGRPAPKVIDFGIARAVANLEEGTRAQTRAHEIVGTRWYMSPEQAADAAHVDTRTDVYALGVVLYELLAGVLPFELEALRALPPEELHRRLYESPLPLPSARVARLASADQVARRRGSDRRGLVRALSGDLDWITLKALAREPEQRYPTASELGADLRRHLAHQPVQAGPPDLGYQLRKLVRRHRVVVAAGAGVFLALLIGLLATIWAALEVAEQRDAEQEHARVASEAEARALREHAAALEAREAESRLRELAEERAREASAAAKFLTDTISLADAEVALSPDVLRSMLHHAGAQVGLIFAADPKTEATLRRAIGQAWQSLGELDLAEGHLARAFELQSALDTVETAELYRTALRLSQVQEDSDSRRSTDMGLTACAHASEMIRRVLPEIGFNLQKQLLLAHFVLLDNLGANGEMPTFDELDAALERELPRGHELWPVVADIWEYIGYQLGFRLDDPGGLPFLQRALEIRRRELEPRHPDVARTSGRLWHLLDQLERHEEARRLADERIRILQAYLPADAWALLEARSQLGASLSGMGRYAEAERLLLDSQRAMLAERGPTNAGVLDASWRLVRHYTRIGDARAAERYRDQLAEALAFSRNASKRFDRRAAAFRPDQAELVQALSHLERDGTELDEGLADPQALYAANVERVIDLRRAMLADDEPRAALVGRMLAQVPLGLLPLELRRKLLDEELTVLDLHRERLPVEVAEAWSEYGRLAFALGRADEADPRFQEAWSILVGTEGRCSDKAIFAERELASADVALGRAERAFQRAEQTWAECIASLGAGHENTIAVLDELVLLCEIGGSLGRCEPFLIEHLEGRIEGDQTFQRLWNAAWLIVRVPLYSRGARELALAAAQRAAELVPDDRAMDASVVWTTLGAALLRCERPAEALEALVHARELADGLDPRNRAFAVLAAHELGRDGLARELLDCMEDELEAIPDDAWPNPAELQRVAEEARLALGVEAPHD